MEDGDEKTQLLVELVQDFSYAARQYGEIIGSERFLPYNKKTIKPVSIGGVAGGEKFASSISLFNFHFNPFFFSKKKQRYVINGNFLFLRPLFY